ncbi:hypothetical protein GOBAR_AA32497 [Gossypium barbadense]|uniref:Leucine-rich repeat-containing N-terminal plant-type domain-containing protein n=1 Tax=Gossypium barbadense TaxID=3634 RepID=A0A2P5WAT7_GOSBA|nr:hypothetical protein GOBAR_AA32497 [Gossypium barbadense]
MAANFTLFLVIFCAFFQLSRPFTVIMTDSGVPSTLIDGPQTGFSINKNGARTNPQEQDAVYDIMRATGNDWATDIPDVCRGRWHGIECMPDKDNVYHIVSLSFGALSDDTAFPTCDQTKSYLSESITKLPHLRTLFFYRCFTCNPQPIPKFLGQLGSTLQTLVLRENRHIGSIPAELGNLTRLRVLDLHKNNLNGSVPSLVKIDFSHNRLTGSIPDSFSGLKELILMDVSYNRLSGPFPTSLSSLTSLQALILKGNQMGSTAIPSDCFDGMKDLMILVLLNMNLHGPIPESLGRLNSLRVAYLDGNHFNGSIPSNFRDLKNVSELRLNDNHLTGPIPFGREMVWKMGRKLRLNNNSGLCYNANNGFEDAFDRGIGLCDAHKPGSARTVQHLSNNTDGDMTTTINVSAGAVRKTSVSVRLSQLASLFLFILLSLQGK